ncbi:MAG TPA: beta-ketoacyl synthase chain length factor [Casimicrobiaceae bacterium]|nr:beta-ketoacyl synthase chain length factor [Casimicrobiaceae bacterium]
MTPLHLEGIGVRADGLVDWISARAVLRGEIPFVPSSTARPSAAALPATERRRANDTARWALDAAGQAAAGLDAEELALLPTVFASADGDGEVLARMLHDLAGAPVALSPTTFHNSVFNAPSGYWSIAARAPAASTTLCADEASFAAGMLEAAAQADATGGPVLVVACDHAFPAASPIVTPARAAFACALRFAAASTGRVPIGRIEVVTVSQDEATPLPGPLAEAFDGNAAAAALPLLAAVAGGREATIRLPYLDGTSVTLRWVPCA